MVFRRADAGGGVAGGGGLRSQAGKKFCNRAVPRVHRLTLIYRACCTASRIGENPVRCERDPMTVGESHVHDIAEEWSGRLAVKPWPLASRVPGAGGGSGEGTGAGGSVSAEYTNFAGLGPVAPLPFSCLPGWNISCRPKYMRRKVPSALPWLPFLATSWSAFTQSATIAIRTCLRDLPRSRIWASARAWVPIARIMFSRGNRSGPR